MALMRRLLRQHGHGPLAASVKSRYSRTMHEQQLPNGCVHCDTLEGNFPSTRGTEPVALSGADGLGMLLTAA